MTLSSMRALEGIIEYSERYCDADHEYRHVFIPEEEEFPKYRLFKEVEWRALGLEMSPGWMHYAVHKPEPHILLFRRVRDFDDLSLEEQRLLIAESDMMVEKLNKEWRETWERKGKIEPVQEMDFLM